MFFVFPDNLTLGSKRAVTSFYITNADWTHLCIDNILKKKDLLPIIATSTISTKKQNKNTKKNNLYINSFRSGGYMEVKQVRNHRERERGGRASCIYRLCLDTNIACLVELWELQPRLFSTCAQARAAAWLIIVCARAGGRASVYKWASSFV